MVGPPMKLNESLYDFFESGFCDAYWPATKDPAKAAPQARQALDLLGARSGHILDWRGGWGSHALCFAQRGLTVSLLDFSQRYIDMSRSLSKRADETDAEGNVRRATHRFDFATNTNHSVFELVRRNGETLRQEFHQTLYSPRDLAALLTDAGFSVDSLFGGYGGEPLTFDSRKVVAVARVPR
jgi:hypothetical protein